MGWDGMGWDGMGWNGMGWMGRDGMGWDEVGWGGMRLKGWDAVDTLAHSGMQWDSVALKLPAEDQTAAPRSSLSMSTPSPILGGQHPPHTPGCLCWARCRVEQ